MTKATCEGLLLYLQSQSVLLFYSANSLKPCPVIEHFMQVEPLLRGHLSYVATFSWSQV
jgi:hypothetical protein